MRLVSSIQHKTCADGSYMKEYELDTPLTHEFFAYLKSFGKVETLAGLGEGYYNFEKTDWFSIKGFVGDSTVEVRFRRDTMDITSDFLRILFLGFRGDGTEDIAGLKEKELARDAQVRNITG